MEGTHEECKTDIVARQEIGIHRSRFDPRFWQICKWQNHHYCQHRGQCSDRGNQSSCNCRVEHLQEVMVFTLDSVVLITSEFGQNVVLYNVQETSAAYCIRSI